MLSPHEILSIVVGQKIPVGEVLTSTAAKFKDQFTKCA